MGKHFKFIVFTFLENALNIGIFIHAPVPHTKRQAEFFENLFPPTAERGGENYDLLYQNSIRKHGDDSEHSVIYVLYAMALQFCKYLSYSVAII